MFNGSNVNLDVRVLTSFLTISLAASHPGANTIDKYIHIPYAHLRHTAVRGTRLCAGRRTTILKGA